MSFCKLSNELTGRGYTQIENNFIVEFLPNLNPLALKVYLHGLYLCQNGIDHTVEDFMKTFDLSKDDVESLFKSLEELNLVDCIDTNPMEVRYLPIKNSSMFLKKFDVRKFKTFNAEAQSLLYCVFKKGDTVSANYILTVLRNWAREGIKTASQVDERIENEERYNDDIKLVLTTLSIKRASTMEEKDMFLDWTNNLGFSLDTIIHVAKITKKKKGDFLKLNALINKCFELSKLSTKEIDDFFAMEEEYYNIAKTVCRNLGIHYDNLSIVVETYVSSWCNLGFDAEALNKLSLYCFTSNIKSLQGMDNIVNKFFKLGILTLDIRSFPPC